MMIAYRFQHPLGNAREGVEDYEYLAARLGRETRRRAPTAAAVDL
jgi:hypothetical protein